MKRREKEREEVPENKSKFAELLTLASEQPWEGAQGVSVFVESPQNPHLLTDENWKASTYPDLAELVYGLAVGRVLAYNKAHSNEAPVLRVDIGIDVLENPPEGLAS